MQSEAVAEAVRLPRLCPSLSKQLGGAEAEILHRVYSALHQEAQPADWSASAIILSLALRTSAKTCCYGQIRGGVMLLLQLHGL